MSSTITGLTPRLPPAFAVILNVDEYPSKGVTSPAQTENVDDV